MAQPTQSAVPLFGLYLLGVGAAGVGNLVSRLGERGGWLPGWGRITVGILAIIPRVVVAILFWRMLRSELDEMLQRIVLEGMAFALVLYIPLAALYVNLRTAGAWTPRLDPPDIMMIPASPVAIGVVFA